MEFGKALTYPFEDEEWVQKLLIGAVVGLVPIVNFALYGWGITIIKNVKDGKEQPLPAWDDFGGFFMKGLLAVVAGIIYQLPYLIAVGVGLGAQFGLTAAAAGGDNGGAFATLGSVVLACCVCVGLLYMIVALAALMAGTIRFAETGTFSTFMEFGTNFSLFRENLGQFLMAILFIILAGILLALGTAITLGLGGLVVAVVQAYFVSHLMGQLAGEIQMGGEPAPAAA